MVNGQWSMVNGQESMVKSQWSMVKSQWSMVNGQWSIVNGQWSMVNSQWSMVNGQWSMVNGYPQNVNKSCRFFSPMLNLFAKIATQITKLPSLRFSFVCLNQSISLNADNTTNQLVEVGVNKPPILNRQKVCSISFLTFDF
jgi:hypothetical protein